MSRQKNLSIYKQTFFPNRYKFRLQMMQRNGNVKVQPHKIFVEFPPFFLSSQLKKLKIYRMSLFATKMQLRFQSSMVEHTWPSCFTLYHFMISSHYSFRNRGFDILERIFNRDYFYNTLNICYGSHTFYL